jgi:SAM-dependent methyltransferase
MRQADSAVAALDLRYCTEWRSWLWTEPVLWALGDIARFRDKRVLELGCRFGKMSCYFASLGAFVDGVDVLESYLKLAREEAEKWGLSDRINFFTYNGNLRELAGGYDFVFTKSTLVIMGDIGKSAADIATLLKPSGEYLAVENSSGGPLLKLARRFIHRNWKGYDQFKGLDDTNIPKLAEAFQQIECRKFYDVVVAIRAKWPKGHAELSS